MAAIARGFSLNAARIIAVWPLGAQACRTGGVSEMLGSSFYLGPTGWRPICRWRRRSARGLACRISSGTPGWVTVDATHQRGRSLNCHAARASAEGTVLVRSGARGGVLEFTPWGLVRFGYIISAGTFIALVLIVEP
jgi:hypothetical protein